MANIFYINEILLTLTLKHFIGVIYIFLEAQIQFLKKKVCLKICTPNYGHMSVWGWVLQSKYRNDSPAFPCLPRKNA